MAQNRLPGLLVGMAIGCLGVGCSGEGDELPSPTPDPPPVVTILSPASGAVLYPGAPPFVFSASVVDARDDEVFLETYAELIKDGNPGERVRLSPDAAGNVSYSLPYLEEGNYVFLLQALDSALGVGSAELAFSVRNQAPAVTIGTPTEGTFVDQGIPLTLLANVADADQPVGRPFEVRLLVNGNALESAFSADDGTVQLSYTPTEEGVLELGIEALDELNANGRSSVFLTVRPCLDTDLDGFFTCSKNGNAPDCDDADAQISPASVEVCNGKDDNCDGLLDREEQDLDFDTHPPCDKDCDDTDPNIYDGARELCDGRDNDCDGLVPIEENDGDGDGYRGCPSDGLSADCDDVQYSVNPGATEVCDARDNDCDGALLPEEADEDDDAFMLCEGDCDDAHYYTWPGAPERLDFLDNNCDGAIEGNLTMAAAQARYDGIQTDGQAGYSVSVGRDINGDGVQDLAVGAPRFSGVSTSGGNRGGVFLILGRSAGWTSQQAGSLSRSIVLHTDEQNARFGSAVSLVGDMNGDSVGDVMIGAPGHVVNSFTEAGAAYLVAGRKEWANAEIDTVILTMIEGTNATMNLGTSISGGGDVNGDDVLDVVTGGPWTGRRPTATGVLAILNARSFGWSARTNLNTLTRVLGTESNAIGTSLALMSRSGDAFDDLLVGGLGTTSSPPGVMFWVPGSASLRGATQLTTTNLNARYYQGDTTNERIASSVASGADVDGDGLEEVLIGRALDGASGDAAAYLLFGSQTPPVSGVLEKVANVRFLRSAGDECPCAVVGLEDFNGDGLGDVAIGVSRANLGATDAGAVYLFLGRGGRTSWPATLGLDEADGILSGEGERDQVGYALASGDLNNDGASDLIIGAPYASGRDERGNLYPSAGRAYVVLGTP